MDCQKIEQVYIAEHLKLYFSDVFMKTYSLKKYYDPEKPSFFYGLWQKEDVDILLNHKGIRIIIWTGGDIHYNCPKRKEIIEKNLDQIKNLPNTYHIAISKTIKKSLTQLNINHIFVPIMGIDFKKYTPVKKGESIYIYTNLTDPEYYGQSKYKKIIEKYPDINFIFTGCQKELITNSRNGKYCIPTGMNNYTHDDLVYKIYSKCFLGLRLTEHDGLAATVQELGLLGIKCVHNGASPSSLNYKSIEDIYDIIDKERQFIGTIDYETANNVKKYLTMENNILNVQYYLNNKYLFISDKNLGNHKYIDFIKSKDINEELPFKYNILCIDNTIDILKHKNIISSFKKVIFYVQESNSITNIYNILNFLFIQNNNIKKIIYTLPSIYINIVQDYLETNKKKIDVIKIKNIYESNNSIIYPNNNKKYDIYFYENINHTDIQNELKLLLNNSKLNIYYSKFLDPNIINQCFITIILHDFPVNYNYQKINCLKSLVLSDINCNDSFVKRLNYYIENNTANNMYNTVKYILNDKKSINKKLISILDYIKHSIDTEVFIHDIYNIYENVDIHL